MTEKDNKLKLEKRLDRTETRMKQLDLLWDELFKRVERTETLVKEADTTSNSKRMAHLAMCTDNLDKRLGGVEMALHTLDTTSHAQRLDRLEGNLTELVRPVVNRLAREAISLNLGVTDVAPLHGARWAGDDERKLYKQFNSFLRAQSVQLGRTESGLRIKLMRLLRDEHPVDWQIAGKER